MLGARKIAARKPRLASGKIHATVPGAREFHNSAGAAEIIPRTMDKLRRQKSRRRTRRPMQTFAISLISHRKCLMNGPRDRAGRRKISSTLSAQFPTFIQFSSRSSILGLRNKSYRKFKTTVIMLFAIKYPRTEIKVLFYNLQNLQTKFTQFQMVLFQIIDGW